MKQLLVVAASLASLYIALSAVHSETFGRFECTQDCSGHQAGYDWAEAHDVTEEDECPMGSSNSFHEGCLAYVDALAEAADDEAKAMRDPPGK